MRSEWFLLKLQSNLLSSGLLQIKNSNNVCLNIAKVQLGKKKLDILSKKF